MRITVAAVMGGSLALVIVERLFIEFHCFTVRFNSLNLIHQLMHFYIQ